MVKLRKISRSEREGLIWGVMVQRGARWRVRGSREIDVACEGCDGAVERSLILER